MFGMKAKSTAKKWKDSEPKVDDVKVNVDDMAPVGTEEPKAKAPKKQTFAEAFRAARARPTGSGSTFMWNGKSYHIGTKEEEATRPGGRGPLTRNGGSFPESKKNTPGGRGPLSRSSTGPASKKSDSPVAKAAKTAGEFISTGGGPAAGAVAAGRYMTRGGGSAPSGAGGLGFESLKARRDAHFAALQKYRDAHGIKEPPKPDLSIPLEIPALKAKREDFYSKLEANRKAGGMKMAKGGSVGYSKMEKEHVNQMKKHGVPEKYVKQEQKEAMKYAKGGGIEAKGKTHGKMVRMASGGSVSSRADGIATKGKTNCKYR